GNHPPPPRPYCGLNQCVRPPFPVSFPSSAAPSTGGGDMVVEPCEAHVVEPCETHIVEPCEAHIVEPCEAHIVEPCETHIVKSF
ncbi:MAG: hypothetical protein II532_04210, partial [Bacteroidales bacterium]|nr:hypothetical protein [Bacteroidales bacterium]